MCRKYIHCFMVLWLAPAILMAFQSPSTFKNDRLDSLNRLLSVERQANEKRVGILLELSEGLISRQPVEALYFAQQAYYISQNLDNARLILKTIDAISEIYWQNGEYEKHLEYTFLRTELAESVNDTIEIVKSKEAMAKDYSRLKDHATALAYRLEAIGLLNPSQYPVVLANMQLQVGKTMRKLGDYKEALAYLTKCMNRFKARSLNVSYIESLIEIGEVYLEMKENGKAKVFLNQANNLLDLNTKERMLRSRVLKSLGELYRNINQYDEAIRLLNEAVEIAENLNAKPQMYAVYEQLYLTAERIGNPELALEYHRNLKFLSEKIYFDERQQQSANLRFEYEYDKIQKRNELLEKDRELRKVEIKASQQLNILLAAILFLAVVLFFLIYRVNRQRLKTVQQLEKSKIKLEIQKKDIENQNRLLSQKNTDLDRLNEEKDSLVNIVAHDLKSPLKQIMGLISIIQMEQDGLNKTQLDCLERISGSANKLNQMIKGILDLAAIEANQIKASLTEVDVGKMLIELETDFKEYAKQKNISILFESVDLSEGIQFVMADKQMLFQVMQNLISNAIKFSENNKSIFVGVTQKKTKSLIYVRDQGPGLTESDKAKLFGKFQKLSAAPTGNESSTGLGLAIVKKFVEAMKGEVWAESQPDKGGSTFYVSLPTAQNPSLTK